MFSTWSSQEHANMHFISCAAKPPSGRAALGLVMDVHDSAIEFGDCGQRSIRGFAMRRMANAGQDGHVNWAVAFLLRDLDLPQRAILVLRALNDRDRHADIGKVIGNIPI